jgi:hypothetical protein
LYRETFHAEYVLVAIKNTAYPAASPCSKGDIRFTQDFTLDYKHKDQLLCYVVVKSMIYAGESLRISNLHPPPSLPNVFCIQAHNSGILNGFEITSSIPASNATSTCSDLTFAVTAITGTCPRTAPSCWSSRMRRTHVKPFMTWEVSM